MSLVENFTNFGRTKLTSALGTGAGVTFTVTGGEGAKFPTKDFHVAIDAEIIWISTRTSDTFTALLRGRQGTATASHAIGANVLHGALAHHIKAAMDTETMLWMGVFP